MKNKQTTPTDEALWECVLDAARDAESAYIKLLNASDTLATRMGYREEYVLLRVLPTKPQERNDSARILAWVKSKKKSVLEGFAEARREEERANLLKRLNLTEHELNLLDIAP